MKQILPVVLTLTASAAINGAVNAQETAFKASHLDTYAEVCGAEGGEESCSEISALDVATSRIFTTNSTENALRVLEMDSEGMLSETDIIDLSPYGGAPNSVAISDGKVAVAVQAVNKTDNGQIVLFDSSTLALITTVVAGALPDMVTFTPDGKYLLVANEGEPSDDYQVDPAGSVTVVDMSDLSTRSAGFESLGEIQDASIRVFGPGATVVQDFEPEYIAVSPDSTTAWISLQENNALAILDIASATITDVKGLGFKDHDNVFNALDASNRDGGDTCVITLDDAEECINIQGWPAMGMYLPDAIASFTVNGSTYIASANEGDSRDYDGYSEEARIGDDEYILDPTVFPDADSLKDDAALGRLKVTLATGDTDGDGDYDQIHSFGARSFSIWDAAGDLVYDSGSDFEMRLSDLQQAGQDVWTDSRSDDKGPEPEAVIVGTLGGRPVAFIGLERTSGVFAYDVSTPEAPAYLGYIDTKASGDISPEGLVFARQSDDTAVLVVTNEVSNTVSTYAVSLTSEDMPPAASRAPTVSAGLIEWEDDGYWQVQTINPYNTVCEGSDIRSCAVAAGTYHVINLATGERFENIRVSDATASPVPTVEGGTIYWQAPGYWQVQTIDPYVTVCEGSTITSCNTGPGFYNVINLTTGERFERIEVSASATDLVEVSGNTITWSGSDYWQVQTIDPYETVCEGVNVNSCVVEPGRYNVINLSTGKRYEGVTAGSGGDTGDNSFALKILHMNDHHSHLEPEGATLTLAGVDTDVEYGGFARVVAKFRELEQNADSVLKLHAGDAVTGTLFYTLFKGEADAALMNEVCFDAFALGNHEFDDGDAGLRSFLDDLASGSCGTEVLAANVIPELGVSPLAMNSSTDYIKPYVVKSVGGENVGLIGIDIAFKTRNSSSPDPTTRFLDETETAQQYIDELLAQGVDKIVLMTHYQYGNDLELAQALSGVDVIVGGDSHTLLGEGFAEFGLNAEGPYPTRLTNADGNPVCIVQAWQYSYVVGELDVQFDADGNVTSCSGIPHLLLGESFARDDEAGESVELSGSELAAVVAAIDAAAELSIVTPDASADAILEGYAAETTVLSEAVIGTAAEDLCLERIPGQGRSSLCDVSETASRGSDIGNIVALAFKSQSLTSDIAIQNGGGVRIDIPAGPVTIGDAYTLLPFSNTLLEVDMTGQQIIDTLEDALDFALNPEGSSGAYPYASGLRWDIDATASKGLRFSNVQVKLKGDSQWSAIDPVSVYKVVTNDFIATGRDGYVTLGQISEELKVNTFLDYAQSFVDYVTDVGILTRLPVEDYSTQSYINSEGVLQ